MSGFSLRTLVLAAATLALGCGAAPPPAGKPKPAKATPLGSIAGSQSAGEPGWRIQPEVAGSQTLMPLVPLASTRP